MYIVYTYIYTHDFFFWKTDYQGLRDGEGFFSTRGSLGIFGL